MKKKKVETPNAWVDVDVKNKWPTFER